MRHHDASSNVRIFRLGVVFSDIANSTQFCQFGENKRLQLTKAICPHQFQFSKPIQFISMKTNGNGKVT